jgi:hypothetical protein
MRDGGSDEVGGRGGVAESSGRLSCARGSKRGGETHFVRAITSSWQFLAAPKKLCTAARRSHLILAMS